MSSSAADSLRDRARTGIHAWISRSGQVVLQLRPAAIVTAMTAAALAPVMLPLLAGGPVLAQVLAALGGFGGNFLADVAHDVTTAMTAEAAVAGVTEETMQAMLARRLDSELAGPDAAGLRAEMAGLLLAVNGVDEALRAAIASGVPGLAERISREVAYLGGTVAEFRELGDSMLGALTAIQHDSAFIRAAVADQGDELRRMSMNMILLRRDILRSRPAPPPEPAAGPGGGRLAHHPRACPYPGLASFAEADADWFYGRERLTALLVDQLRGRLYGSAPLMVVGASGAGKSSMLRAGLIPELDTGGLAEPGSELWDRMVMTPGPLPFRDLALRLAQRAELAASTVLDELAADPAAAPLIIAQGLLPRGARRRPGVVTTAPDLAALDPGPGAGTPESAPGRRLVLIIDQFEEIFTQCTDDAERKRFVDAICAAAQGSRRRPPPALVVIGMRMSFTEQCTAHPELEPALRDPLIIGPMSVAELRAAIERPAERAGLSVQPGLAAAMLRDLGAVESPGQPDAASYDPGRLPLLAHALLETWQASDGELTIAAYEAAGGIANALASRADAVYTSLARPGQQVARRLMEHMVSARADAQDTRRRVRRSALISELPAEDAETAGLILDRLEAERLVTADEDTVQFAHEALLRYWPRMAGWLRENRDWRREQQRLTEHAREWDGGGRHPDRLLRGAQLSAVREQLTEARQAELGALEAAYLSASQDRQGAADRNRRAVRAVLIVLVVLAVGLAGLAQVSSVRARQQQAIAESAGLAAQAVALLPGNPQLSLLLSLEAYRVSPTPAAVSSLLSAQASFPVARLAGPADAVNAVAYDPAATPSAPRLASAGQGDAVTIWNARTRRRLGTLRGTSPFYALAWDPAGHLLAGGEQDGTTLVWNMPSRSLAATLRAGPWAVETMAFGPGGLLATAGEDGTVRLWRPAAPAPVRVLSVSAAAISGIAFSPDGRLLAAACSDGTIRVWNLGQDTPPVILQGHQEAVRSVAFSPDSALLASGGDDGDVRLWTLGSRTSRVLLDGTAPVLSVAFSPDGQQLASAGADEAIRLWDVSTRTQAGALTGPASSVAGVAFSPDGSALASADADGTVGLWNIPGPAAPGTAAVTVSRASGRIATAGATDVVSLWRPDGTWYARLPGAASQPAAGTGQNAGAAVAGLALRGDGRMLASITAAGQVTLRGLLPPYRAQLLSDPAPIDSVAFGPGRGPELVAAGGADGDVYLTQPGTRHTAQVGGQATAVGAVAFRRDGRLLAAASADGTIALDAVRDSPGRLSAQPVSQLVTPDRVGAVAFSPGGTILAGASGDEVLLWNVADPARPQQLPAPPGAALSTVISVAFSSDGSTLAAAAQDGTIRLWHVSGAGAAALLATLPGLGSPTSVAFEPGRPVLVGAATDGTAVFWDIRPAEAARQVCATRPAATAALMAPYLGGAAYRPACP